MNILIALESSFKSNKFFKFSFVLIVLGLTLVKTSCLVQEFSNEPDFTKDSIIGSGVFHSEELQLAKFNSINMCTAGLVNITQGFEQKIVVTVDDNVREYIQISVIEGELVINAAPYVRLSKFSLTVDLIMTDLEVISTNSAGNIISKNTFEVDFVTLIINSAGNINLSLNAEHVNSVLNSSGNLTLKGEVVNHSSKICSAGNLLAYDMLSDTTTITLNSAGNAQIYALKLLDITINSSGSAYYKGSAEVIQHINSIGQVICVNK